MTFLNTRGHPKVCKDNKYVRVNFVLGGGGMSNAVHKYLDNDTFPVFGVFLGSEFELLK